MKIFLTLIALFASCGTPSKFAGVNPNSNNTQPAGHSGALCDRVAEIKTLPFKGEPVTDPAYNDLLAAGEKALPCLNEKITDTTPMNDPRQAPKFDGIKVGDVAYFVFVRITKLDFSEVLPPSIKERYKDEGVYAYFKFVEKQENREQLRSELREWHRKNYRAETAN